MIESNLRDRSLEAQRLVASSMNDMRIVPSSRGGYCSKVKYIINYLLAHYPEEVIVTAEKLELKLPISFLKQ